jgi:hypothetical protein
MGQLGNEVMELAFSCQALDVCPVAVLTQQQIERWSSRVWELWISWREPLEYLFKFQVPFNHWLAEDRWNMTRRHTQEIAFTYLYTFTSKKLASTVPGTRMRPGPITSRLWRSSLFFILFYMKFQSDRSAISRNGTVYLDPFVRLKYASLEKTKFLF